jgi:hypothetical protein
MANIDAQICLSAYDKHLDIAHNPPMVQGQADEADPEITGQREAGRHAPDLYGIIRKV